MITIVVNGTRREVQSPADTPLLYVLRNDLELCGPQFGCGLSQCGACSVLVDGKEIRSCITPLGSVRQGGHHARGASRQVGASEKGFRKPTLKRRFIRCNRPGSTNRCRCAASARTA